MKDKGLVIIMVAFFVFLTITVASLQWKKVEMAKQETLGKQWELHLSKCVLLQTGTEEELVESIDEQLDALGRVLESDIWERE